MKLQTINPENNYVAKSKSFKIFSKGMLTTNETKKSLRDMLKNKIKILPHVVILKQQNGLKN